uniref:SSD domain-containing protein n=1 Tax=Panagrolaimus davidi TaxID=227884 RepID=A0A914QJS8_9BILA
MGNKFNMGGHFFGVEQYPENEWSKHESSIKSIEAIALWYIFDIPSNDTTRMDIVKKLLIKLFDKSKTPPSHNLFRYHIYADKVANEEMSRGSKETVNLLIFGLLLMLAFMCISMWSLKLSTKLILIPAAVLTPLLAAATTFGLIGWCGFAYNSIMAVAPFLLLGIGVDDAFLLLHCWRKYRKVKGYSVENEMGLVVSEVGPSILITSVTK